MVDIAKLDDIIRACKEGTRAEFSRSEVFLLVDKIDKLESEVEGLYYDLKEAGERD